MMKVLIIITIIAAVISSAYSRPQLSDLIIGSDLNSVSTPALTVSLRYTLKFFSLFLRIIKHFYLILIKPLKLYESFEKSN